MGPPAAPFNARPMLRPLMTQGQSQQQIPNRPQTPPSAAPPAPPTDVPSPKLAVAGRKVFPRNLSNMAIFSATPQTIATMSPEQVSESFCAFIYLSLFSLICILMDAVLCSAVSRFMT